MKLLLSLACSILLLSACAPKVTHTIDLGDGVVVIKTFNSPCELESAKEMARQFGASEKNVKDMVKAESKFKAEDKPRQACVFFTSDGMHFHIIDEKGEMGLGLDLVQGKE